MNKISLNELDAMREEAVENRNIAEACRDSAENEDNRALNAQDVIMWSGYIKAIDEVIAKLR